MQIKKITSLLLALNVLVMMFLMTGCKNDEQKTPVDNNPTNPPISENVTDEQQKKFEELLNKEVIIISDEDAKNSAINYLNKNQSVLDEKLETMKNLDSSISNDGVISDEENIEYPTKITYDVERTYSDVHIDNEYCGMLEDKETCINDPEDNYSYFKVIEVYTYSDREDRFVASDYRDIDIIVNMITGEVTERNRSTIDVAALNYDGIYKSITHDLTIDIKTTEEGLVFKLEGTYNQTTTGLSGLATIGTRNDTYEFNLGNTVVVFKFNDTNLLITTQNSNSIVEPLLGSFIKE